MMVKVSWMDSTSCLLLSLSMSGQKRTIRHTRIYSRLSSVQLPGNDSSYSIPHFFVLFSEEHLEAELELLESGHIEGPKFVTENFHL